MSASSEAVNLTCDGRSGLSESLQLRGRAADGRAVNGRTSQALLQRSAPALSVAPRARWRARSDAKQAELVLAEVTARFGQAFHSAPIGMALVDVDGVWLAVNASLCSILGYEASQLLELTFQDVTHPDDLDHDLELLQELVGGSRDSYSMEKRYFHQSGRIVWVDLSVSMVKSPEGVPHYFVAQIQDITRRKAGEERLAAYAKRLAASNNELVEFASVAAHDLAEPLRVIEGYLHLLESRHSADLDDDARRFIGHAVDATERLQHLIDDLLAYSRATDAVGPPAVVDLGDVVAGSAASLERLVSETGAVVSIGELPSIWVRSASCASCSRTFSRTPSSSAPPISGRRSASRLDGRKPAGASRCRTTESASRRSIGSGSSACSSAFTAGTRTTAPASAWRSVGR